MRADELIATLLAAQAAFTERVHAIADDQWQLGTPDAQWTVADLVRHLTDEHRWAGPLLAGLDMDDARAVVAGLVRPTGTRSPVSANGTWPWPCPPRHSAPMAR